jgi:hypothetical protein
MTAYATVADFEAYVEGWITDNEAALERLLERASRDIDAVIGLFPVITTGNYAGFKLDPTTLDDVHRQALARATCAQARHRFDTDTAAAAEPRQKRVDGPDFKIEYELPAPAATRYAPELVDELAVLGLPRRTARSRA